MSRPFAAEQVQSGFAVSRSFTAIALHGSTIHGDSQHRLPPLALEAPRWAGQACSVSREQQLPARLHFLDDDLTKKQLEGRRSLRSHNLKLWVMRGTCSWSALLLQILGINFLHWMQTAQVSWLGLCGPDQPMVSRYIIACLDRMSC